MTDDKAACWVSCVLMFAAIVCAAVGIKADYMCWFGSRPAIVAERPPVPQRDARLQSLMVRAEAHIATVEGQSSGTEAFRVSLHAAAGWDRDVSVFLSAELPSELSAYADGAPPPKATAGGAAVASFYRRRMEFLQAAARRAASVTSQK